MNRVEQAGVVEGWAVFERWADRFKTLPAQLPYGYCLSSYQEISSFVSEMCLDPAVSEEWDRSTDFERRAKDKIAFLRDYFVDISFDGGNFYALVKHLLKHQSPRYCAKGFGVWFGKHNIETEIFQCTNHFRGDDVSIFCSELSDIDYATVMSICPFDRIVVRAKQDWAATNEKRFTKTLKDDLGFDGINVSLRPTFSRLHTADNVLAFDVNIRSPKNVYFDYRRSP